MTALYKPCERCVLRQANGVFGEEPDCPNVDNHVAITEDYLPLVPACDGVDDHEWVTTVFFGNGTYNVLCVRFGTLITEDKYVFCRNCGLTADKAGGGVK